MKIELYYFQMGIPRCVRIISNKLQLDHTFFPAAGPVDNFGSEDYMKMIKDGVFSDVRILPEENDAYILAPEPEGKIYINDWVSLSDYSKVIPF